MARSKPVTECLISSARVFREGTHDVVVVWNRGAMAGKLLVSSGDGARIANLLFGDPDSDEGTRTVVSFTEDCTMWEIDE